MRNRLVGISVGAILAVTLIGCAEIDAGLKHTADALAPTDVVTGKRTLNLESEDEEIRRATNQTAELLNELKSQGVAVDTDEATLSKLQTMLKQLAAVSHRPHLPWEIHLIEHGDVNAFTIGGGKLFVFRGLFGGLIDPREDNELAAVLAHEIGHVNARHVGKGEALRLAAGISRHARKEVGGTLFQASFTTLQEDEADRIGLLYMSLAGYNPTAASAVWQRAHEKYGSDPGDYAYDHSLNLDRFNKVSALVPTAMKYFRGQGITNDEYDRLRVDNELIPRTGSFAGESGFLAMLEAGLGSYSDYLNAKNEALRRQLNQQQEQARASQIAKILSVEIGDTTDGYKGVFGQIQNASNQVIERAEITVNYYNAQGQILYSERIQVDSLNLRPGSMRKWGTYLKNVPGMSRVGALVTKIETPE